VAGAGHNSLLGQKYADAVVRGVLFVRDAAANTDGPALKSPNGLKSAAIG
jgi:hypothetical protein